MPSLLTSLMQKLINCTMSRRARALVLRILLFLFYLNVISLSLYFILTSPSSQSLTKSDGETSTPSQSEFETQTQNRTLKSWPILPSFLPWTPNPPLGSCEAYFGNGFSDRIQVLGPESDAGNKGFLRCLYSRTLMSSIWEMGGVRMDPGRIRMSKGGEALETVIGRAEDEELPRFEEGAFEIEGDGDFTGGKAVGEDFLQEHMGQAQHPTMRALVDSIRVVEPGKLGCSQWIEEPTVLVTRFEYANLFHTVTDWYGAYVSCRVTNLPSRPHLIFVDGHCKTQLEETWEALFSSIRYAKNFSGPVCLRHAILAPLGYETALFKGLSEGLKCQGTRVDIPAGNSNYHRTSRLSEFGEMLRAAFDLLDLPRETSTGHNVLFVRREDYLAHPRHNGRVESRLSNEQEVFDAIKNWAVNHTKCKVNVINGLFAHMPMKEQLRAIQEASVVIGAHGAGLTHLVAATPETVVLEIISSSFQRPHFSLISRWKGLEYHPITLAASYARPHMVINELHTIMKSLKC